MQLKSAFITLCSAALTFSLLVSEPLKAQTNFTLPDLGTSALQALPLEKEQAIGEVMMMQIRGSSPVINDPVLDEYLTTIGRKLVANANDVRFPFSFFWINNSEINAFAFYGGHVGVHTGLIAQADNESQFASVLGHEIAHVTQRHLARRIQQQQDKAKATSKNYQAAHKALPTEYKMGTVGAVALDKNGNLAAGTSTGGMTAKRFGRIGDAPVIGAGTFAENESCAVSATGHGEYFIRYNVASDICARVKYQNKTIAQAGDEVINQVLAPIGGTGGVIIVDAKGNISLPFNTSGMYRASKSNTQATYVGIFNDE